MKSTRLRLRPQPVLPPKPNPPGSAIRSFAALVSAFFLVGGIIFAKPVSELSISRAAQNTRLIEPDIEAGIRASIISCGPDRLLSIPSNRTTSPNSNPSMTYSLDALQEAKDEVFESIGPITGTQDSLFSEEAGSVSTEAGVETEGMSTGETPFSEPGPTNTSPTDSEEPSHDLQAPGETASGVPDESHDGSSGTEPESAFDYPQDGEETSALVSGDEPTAASSGENVVGEQFDFQNAWLDMDRLRIESGEYVAVAGGTEGALVCAPAPELASKVAEPEDRAAELGTDVPAEATAASEPEGLVAPQPPAAPIPTPAQVRRFATAIPTFTPRPTPVPTLAPLAAALGSVENEVVAIHNSERARAGVRALTVDPGLAAVARQRARDMASRGYFGHVSPAGETVFTLLGATGVRYREAAENIARNEYAADRTVSVAMSMFLSSSVHRENILDPGFTRVGVAVETAGKMKYYVIVFAGP